MRDRDGMGMKRNWDETGNSEARDDGNNEDRGTATRGEKGMATRRRRRRRQQHMMRKLKEWAQKTSP
jgi:hypothetical protein